MKLAMCQIDAFTHERFKGHPAAVVSLDGWLSDAQMQAIAAENNLSETAFVILEQRIAAAPLVFRAAAVGGTAVVRREDGLLEMSFPNRAPEPVAEPPQVLLAALNLVPECVLRNRQAWFAVAPGDL
ncbi:hypothetical protein CXK94_04705 [Stutzerimonas stutzeri]|uniref:PhzF family phenazine biosynthesis protein n=2 Tax=Stutzerimonas stutzeri TaxID=316 RepID=A0A2N8T8F1_STUST|nr:hypothetical protein CXK94_04705 [Stutzerimonas stutzeri]